MRRILKAFVYSYDGFCAAIKEPAFYQEFGLAIVLITVACFLPIKPIFLMLIICAHLLTMIVELLNTGIERTVDLVTQEPQPLAKIAKDVGSLAVLLSFFVVFVVWGFALFDAYK